MSFPFAQAPTLIDYIGWCNQQGCTTKSAYDREDGTMITVQVLESRSGRHVVISGIAMNERLLRSQVANFDRRLGLESPFYPKIGSEPDC